MCGVLSCSTLDFYLIRRRGREPPVDVCISVEECDDLTCIPDVPYLYSSRIEFRVWVRVNRRWCSGKVCAVHEKVLRNVGV